jgi:plastocyanin
MPDWMIKIVKVNAPTADQRIVFDPDPLEAFVGDIINWHNNDSRPHWPAPLDPNAFDPQKQEAWMDFPIPAGASSKQAYSPPDRGVQLYCCALHPKERGRIIVS